jgi:hypothetical protein
MGGACNTRVGDQNYEQAFKREVWMEETTRITGV